MEGNYADNKLIDRDSIQFFSEIIDFIKENQSNLSEPADPNMGLLSEQITNNLSTMSSIFNKIQKSLTEDYQSELFLNVQNLSKYSFAREIGINLLKNKVLEKPIESESIVFDLQKNYWDALLQRMIKSIKFNSTIEKLNNFHHEIINEKIIEELKKIPIEIEPNVREDYKKAYYSNPLTFSEYLNIEQKKHQERQNYYDQQTDSFDSSEKLRKEFVEAIEKKKLDKKKEEQEKQFDNYKSYFKMDERELQRAKRNGKMRRKYTKKTRRNKK